MLGPVFLHRILTFICVQGFAEVWIGTSFEKDGASKTWSASCTDLDSETLRTGSVRCVSLWLKFVETWAERVHWTGQMKETVKPRTVVVRQLYICNHLYILIRFVAIFSKHFLMAKHTLWSSRDAQHLGSTFWPKQCPQILWLKICTTLDSIIFMSLDVFICVRCFSICWLLMLFQE